MKSLTASSVIYPLTLEWLPCLQAGCLFTRFPGTKIGVQTFPLNFHQAFSRYCGLYNKLCHVVYKQATVLRGHVPSCLSCHNLEHTHKQVICQNLQHLYLDDCNHQSGLSFDSLCIIHSTHEWTQASSELDRPSVPWVISHMSMAGGPHFSIPSIVPAVSQFDCRTVVRLSQAGLSGFGFNPRF